MKTQPIDDVRFGMKRTTRTRFAVGLCLGAAIAATLAHIVGAAMTTTALATGWGALIGLLAAPPMLPEVLYPDSLRCENCGSSSCDGCSDDDAPFGFGIKRTTRLVSGLCLGAAIGVAVVGAAGAAGAAVQPEADGIFCGTIGAAIGAVIWLDGWVAIALFGTIGAAIAAAAVRTGYWPVPLVGAAMFGALIGGMYGLAFAIHAAIPRRVPKCMFCGRPISGIKVVFWNIERWCCDDPVCYAQVPECERWLREDWQERQREMLRQDSRLGRPSYAWFGSPPRVRLSAVHRVKKP